MPIGITWLLGLLTPSGAFIKACQAIYGIVMWFVNNAKRIMDLINSIIDSTALIVAGKLDSAADMVENAMAKIIPIAIGFLAGLLNLGNIGKLVQDIINKVRAPIEKAIDWVVQKAVAVANQLGIPQMIKKGVNFVKGKVDAVKGKVNQMMGKGEEKDKKIHIDEHFTAKDGSQHEMRFGDGNENKTLMVASWHPVALLQKLDQKSKATSDGKTKARLEDMKTKVGEIQKRAAQLLSESDHLNQNSSDAVKMKATENNWAKIKAELEPLIPDLIALEVMDENDNLPHTIVTYDTKNDVAHKVVAAPLTKYSGNTQGSSPTKDPKIPLGWEYVIDLEETLKVYVKAHMLSERLHGPGNQGWNLVPGRRFLNGQMSDDVEQHAIERINKGEILRYETTVKKYTNDTNEPKIGSFFPLEMEVTYGAADRDGKFKGEKITRLFSQPAPRQKAGDEKNNLSTMAKTRLAAAIKLTNKGLTSEVANDIAKKLDDVRKTHPFVSFIDFVTKGNLIIGDEFTNIAENLEKAGYDIPNT